MKNLPIPAILLAAILQLLPMIRTSEVLHRISSPLLSIVFRWATVSAALMGGIDAVSGASTLINSPLAVTATNGIQHGCRGELRRVVPRVPGALVRTHIRGQSWGILADLWRWHNGFLKIFCVGFFCRTRFERLEFKRALLGFLLDFQGGSLLDKDLVELVGRHRGMLRAHFYNGWI